MPPTTGTCRAAVRFGGEGKSSPGGGKAEGSGFIASIPAPADRAPIPSLAGPGRWVSTGAALLIAIPTRFARAASPGLAAGPAGMYR
jgi:hypothetical protein